MGKKNLDKEKFKKNCYKTKIKDEINIKKINFEQVNLHSINFFKRWLAARFLPAEMRVKYLR